MTDDMKRMQQEAAEHARQMQKRARSYPHSPESSCLPLTPPPLTRRPAVEEPMTAPLPCPPAETAKPSGLGGLLGGDPDRMFLILLIFLLMKNNASMELIIALCYLAL